MNRRLVEAHVADTLHRAVHLFADHGDLLIDDLVAVRTRLLDEFFGMFAILVRPTVVVVRNGDDADSRHAVPTDHARIVAAAGARRQAVHSAATSNHFGNVIDSVPHRPEMTARSPERAQKRDDIAINRWPVKTERTAFFPPARLIMIQAARGPWPIFMDALGAKRRFP